MAQPCPANSQASSSPLSPCFLGLLPGSSQSQPFCELAPFHSCKAVWLPCGVCPRPQLRGGPTCVYTNPSLLGPKILCGVVPEPEHSSSVLTWILGVLLESPQGSQSSSRVGACTCSFLPSCSSSVTLPVAWIMGSATFPRGFPMRLSQEAYPQGCSTCHRGVSRSSV